MSQRTEDPHNQETGDLCNKKITVTGDRVSGMCGNETIHGPAVVTGTHVVYGKQK